MDDPEAFDFILDTIGEVWRARNLIKRSGSICSVIAFPTTKGILDWLEASRISSSSMTTGVGPFLHSSWGVSMLNCLTGERSMINHCKEKRDGATFATIIGRGDGGICADIAHWIKTGKVRESLSLSFSSVTAAVGQASANNNAVMTPLSSALSTSSFVVTAIEAPG